MRTHYTLIILSIALTFQATLPLNQTATTTLFTDLGKAYKQLTTVLAQSPEQRSQIIDLTLVLLRRESDLALTKSNSIVQDLYQTLSDLFMLELKQRNIAEHKIDLIKSTIQKLYNYQLEIHNGTIIFPLRKPLLCVLLETYRIKIVATPRNPKQIIRALSQEFIQVRSDLLITPEYTARERSGPSQEDIDTMIATLLWNVQPYTPQKIKHTPALHQALMASGTIVNLCLASAIITATYMGYSSWKNNNYNILESFHTFLHGTSGEQKTPGLIDHAATITEETRDFLNGRSGILSLLSEISRSANEAIKRFGRKF